MSDTLALPESEHSSAGLASWSAVIAIAASSTVFVMTEFLPVGLLRYVSTGFGVTEGTAGLMTTAPGVLAAITALVLPVAIGTADRKHVLIGLTFLLIVSNLISLVTTSFGLLIFARVLFGIGLGGFWAIGAGLGSRLVQAEKVGKATAIIFSGVSLGTLIGVPAGAFISELFGWRYAFVGASILSVLALVTQIGFVPSLPVSTKVSPRDLLNISTSRNGKIGLLAMFLVLSAQFATYTYISPFLAQVSLFDGKSISTLLLAYTVVGILGNFIGGAAAARDVKKSLIAAIALFIVVAALLPVFAASTLVTLALLALWGVAYGIIPVTLQMWMASSSDGSHEGGMALFVANYQTSIGVGSFLGGVVVDTCGLSNVMFFGALLAVLAALSLAFSKGSPGRQAS